MSQVFFDAEKHGNARNRFDAGDMVCVRLAQVLRASLAKDRPVTPPTEPAEPVVKPRVRDAEATKARILDAAKKEFAKNGMGGARVDVISEKAKANKRMIYHYFGSKEGLFQTVLENAYVDIRTAEQKLNLDHLEPKLALERLVRFTWDYYLKNPEFITLVNSENLHRAKHLKKSEIIKVYSRKFVSMVEDILARGVAAGQFRSGIDPVQLNITIAAISYYYMTNRFTGSIVFERDLMAKDALEERLRFNIDTILRLVSAE
jgi:AcrR family transcriptional regulator